MLGWLNRVDLVAGMTANMVVIEVCITFLYSLNFNGRNKVLPQPMTVNHRDTFHHQNGINTERPERVAHTDIRQGSNLDQAEALFPNSMELNVNSGI